MLYDNPRERYPKRIKLKHLDVDLRPSVIENIHKASIKKPKKHNLVINKCIIIARLSIQVKKLHYYKNTNSDII